MDYLSVGGYHKDGAQTHKILLKAGMWIIEGLNLYGVKSGNYDLTCLPHLSITGLNSECCRQLQEGRVGEIYREKNRGEKNE